MTLFRTAIFAMVTVVVGAFALLTSTATAAPLQVEASVQVILPGVESDKNIVLVGGIDCVRQPQRPECNRSTNGASWIGTDNNPNDIEVTVCNPYFDQLDVGTLNGVRTRWWEPVIVKDGWKTDTPVITVITPCTTMWRRPGEQVAVYTSCVNRTIWTEPIYSKGTYTMR